MILNRKSERGFTLIEILASIIVLSAVGYAIAGIITSSFRGANKTNVVENIRQNGKYAIDQVSKTIQYAQVFNGFSRDNVIYTTNCPDSFAPTPTPVVDYNYIKVTPLKGSPITYHCESDTFTANGTNGTLPLIDTSTVSLVSCTFSCIQRKSTDVPIVKINFKLKPISSSNLVEQSTPPITFETSVTVRNYKR